MALPKQVRQQIAEAKRIEMELHAAQESTDPAVVEPTTPPVEEPVVTVAASEPAPVEPVTVEPVVAPQVQQPVEQTDTYKLLLQQHRSLQGIHRELSGKNRELQSQVQTLQASNRQLTSNVEQLKQQLTTPPTLPTDVDADDFDPALVSMIERKAQQIAAQIAAPLNQELTQLRQRNAHLEQSLNSVSGQQQQISAHNFGQQLLQLVPNLNVLNYDQNFLAWLTQINPLDPRQRSMQECLNEAVENGNAHAAANFFNAFSSQQSAPLPLPAQTSKPPVDISAQAQPMSRSGPEVVTPTTNQRIWKTSEIKAFYDDVTKGRYVPAEKQRIEREIYTAQRENRVAA